MESKEYNAQRRETYKTLREMGERAVTDIRIRLIAQCPPCFPSESVWQAWRENSRMNYIPLSEGFCTDCTPEYKAKMVEERRCLWPCVGFKTDSDGMLYGKRLSLDGMSQRILEAIARGT